LAKAVDFDTALAEAAEEVDQQRRRVQQDVEEEKRKVEQEIREKVDKNLLPLRKEEPRL
jgi:F0F1-type ATP synthase membrane subunit b/b'